MPTLKNAKPIPYLTYHQADQLARLGAKVLHPRAVKPAAVNNIPILVKSTLQPERSGTHIKQYFSDDSKINNIKTHQRYGVVALAIETKISLLKCTQQNKQSVIDSTLALGFDQIVCLDSNASAEIAFIYANSDKPQPEDEQVMASTSDISTFKSGYGLVSLVGHFDEGQMVALKQNLTPKMQTLILQIYQPNDCVISFLVPSKDTLQISQQLHKLLLEDDS